MFLFFLPLVYASMYDHETMLETVTLESEVDQARVYQEYVAQVSSDILSYGWDYKRNLTVDEMFQMSLPMMRGMGLSMLSLNDANDELVETVELCGELYDNSTVKLLRVKDYFSAVEMEADFQLDLEQKQNTMEEDLRFIDELCINVLDGVKNLYAMSFTYSEHSQIFLTRAKMILEEYSFSEETARALSEPAKINYTEALYNYSLMQNLTNMIYTIHHNLTSEENEYI